MERTVKEKKIQKKYEEEFKRQAVELVIHSGKAQAQIARELGVSGYSLNLWKKAYLKRMEPAQLGSRQMSPEQMVAEIKRQQKEIEYLRRQREILKKSYEHTGQGTEHRYAMIKELSVKFGIKECCQVLEVSRSGYYQWVKPGRSERAKAEAKLVEQIVEVFEANKERYGSPRVTRELRQQGVRCSENRAARLMRENELVARVPGRTRR